MESILISSWVKGDPPLGWLMRMWLMAGAGHRPTVLQEVRNTVIVGVQPIFTFLEKYFFLILQPNQAYR